MRKLSHKRALNQQSLDIFFKPKKEKDLDIKIPNEKKPSPIKSNIQNCFLDHAHDLDENTKYDQIVSDFELDFSTDENENQDENRDSSFGRNSNNQKNPTPDDDPEYEKDEEYDDSYYNDSQVSSPTIVTRHQELEKKNEKINIFTPTWSFANSVGAREEKNYPHIKFDLNSMCNIHYQLEVIEKRIQNGDDEEHEHPAMCVQVLNEEGLSEVTNEEKKLRGDYDEIKYDQIKPSFWEPRCYDDEYCELTKNDNRNLQSAICLANDAEYYEIVTWEPEDDLIQSRNPISHKTTSTVHKSEDTIVKDTSKSYSPKFVFVNSPEKKVPKISFVYKGQSKNSKKTLKHTDFKQNTRKEGKENEKELITHKPKIEKKVPNKVNENQTLFDIMKKNSNQKPSSDKISSQKNTKTKMFNLFNSDYSSETDSSATDSESDISSAHDSSDEEENANENSNIIETSIVKKQPTISKQKMLRLSSLLFDTDLSDSETDLENF